MPPANVQVTNVTISMLKVTSTGVPVHNRNGIILKYQVNWTAYDGSSQGIESCVNSTLITCYITGLKFYTLYNISMTSFTRLGAGNYSTLLTVLTAEWGEYCTVLLPIICLLKILYYNIHQLVFFF